MMSCDPTLFTCLEFWFSILVLTSGWRVKSGAKYSKYSSKEGGGRGGMGVCMMCVCGEEGGCVCVKGEECHKLPCHPSNTRTNSPV